MALGHLRDIHHLTRTPRYTHEQSLCNHPLSCPCCYTNRHSCSVGGGLTLRNIIFVTHQNMSGRGKGGKARNKGKSRSVRAGLQFTVGRIHRLLRKGSYADRVGAGAPMYLAAVPEYLTAAVFVLAGNAARQNKKTRIITSPPLVGCAY